MADQADDAVPVDSPNDQAISPASPGGAPTVIIQSAPPSRQSRVFFRTGWILFLLCLISYALQRRATEDYFDTSGGLEEHFHSLSPQGRKKIAILEIEGVIGSGQAARRQIERIRNDENVVAVVLRVNSPGGTVTGSDYIYHHLLKLKQETSLPMVVSMGAIAASGGYYVSMAVGSDSDSIYAEPTTTTGSIGVIIPHYDLSGLLAEMNIKDDSIVSHQRKQMLSMTRPISDEHREILQDHVNDAFQRFKQIVMAGRPALQNDEHQLLAVGTDINIATGEIFTASRALEYGLVDKIGFIEDAIERALELARQQDQSLDPDNVRAVWFEEPRSLLDFNPLIQANNPLGSIQALLELSVPRRYYLTTTLPALITGADSQPAR